MFTIINSSYWQHSVYLLYFIPNESQLLLYFAKEYLYNDEA